jgi:hypothetical protein
MWDEFTVVPKEDLPAKGTKGTFLFRKLAEIFMADEMMSDLETVAWSPINPNPVTLRKYFCFQGVEERRLKTL